MRQSNQPNFSVSRMSLHRNRTALSFQGIHCGSLVSMGRSCRWGPAFLPFGRFELCRRPGHAGWHGARWDGVLCDTRIDPNERGLVAVNHEYTDQVLLFQDGIQPYPPSRFPLEKGEESQNPTAFHHRDRSSEEVHESRGFSTFAKDHRQHPTAHRSGPWLA